MAVNDLPPSGEVNQRVVGIWKHASVNFDLQEALDGLEAPGEQVGLTLVPKWRTGKQLR